MKESEFWRYMTDEFGEDYARVLARSQTLTPLGGATAEQALEAGTPAKRVWEAVCEHMSVPESRRFGRDLPLKNNLDVI
ncbi:DUF3046 domain-containing protein [Gephyromycinifex aptenodytis]|uniref:DUF3046 domain-containing protein n=1 Tax=Gephyromycinifex aptenodytis TaxID=2716227 RepID=UPI0014479BCF|nr:DUF3046 domain-containing protein [Gephyromycinifex aptenodytis]